MKYLVGDRGSGITSTLLLEASQFDGVLIVPRAISFYKEKCKEMNIKCPRIITFKEFLNGEDNARGINFSKEKVFIDSVGELFKQIGLHNVITAGDSI